MTRIDTGLDGLIAGKSSAWLIAGESGVGKSRLMDELRNRALTRGVAVFRGQGVESGDNAYQLWKASLLRLLLNIEVSDLEAGVLKVVAPDIERVLERPIPDAPPLLAQQSQDRLQYTLLDILQRQPQPILLLLDDLQWAKQSLVILDKLLANLDSYHVMIVASYRSEEAPELAQRYTTMQHIKLVPLSSDNIAELSVSMLGDSGKNSVIIDILNRETEGNAFFLVEVVRALADDAGQLHAIGQVTIPSTIMTGGMDKILQSRIEKIPIIYQDLLKTTAIIGRAIQPTLLQHLTKLNVDDFLLLGADAAIFSVRENQWRFAHDKLREKVLRDMSSDEITAEHERVAQAMEAIYHREQHYTEIAFHYDKAYQGGKTELHDKTRDCLWLAGLQMETHYENQSALDFFLRAFALADDTLTQYTMLAAAEKMQGLLGEHEAQKQSLEQLAQLATTLADTQKQVQTALRKTEYANNIGNYELMQTSAAEALKLAQSDGDVDLLAHGHEQLGAALGFRGMFKQGITHLERAVELARSIGGHHRIGVTLLTLSTTCLRGGDQNQAETKLKQALQHLQHVDDKRNAARCLNTLGVVASLQGRLSDSLQHYEAGLAAFRAIGERRGTGICLHNLGATARSIGLYEQGYDYFKQATELYHSIGDRASESILLTDKAMMIYQEEDFERALTTVEEALSIAREIQYTYAEYYAMPAYAHILTALDRYDEALSTYQQVDEWCVQRDNQRDRLEVLAGMANIAYRQGDIPKALEQVNLVLELMETSQSFHDPYYTYLICTRILSAVQDERLLAIQEKACKLLQTQAASLTDEAQRTAFMNNVPSHHKLFALCS